MHHAATIKGCCMCFLPECFAFIGAQKGEAQAVAEPLEGKLMARYKFLAKTAAIWMSLGGFQVITVHQTPTINSGL